MRKLTETQIVAIHEYASTLISYEYDFHREYNRERFEKLTEENKNRFEEKIHNEAKVLVEAILDKSSIFVKKFLNGLFDLQNPASRKLFIGLTGLSLPKTQKEISVVIHQYAGKEIEEYLEQKRKEDGEKLALAKTAIEAKERTYQDQLSVAVLSDSLITGSELVDLCYFLKVNIHPRTVGLLRKRIVRVNSSQSEYRGKKIPMSHYELYRECKEKLEQTKLIQNELGYP